MVSTYKMCLSCFTISTFEGVKHKAAKYHFYFAIATMTKVDKLYQILMWNDDLSNSQQRVVAI